MSIVTEPAQPRMLLPDHTQLPDSDGLPVDNAIQPAQASLLTDSLDLWLMERHPNQDYFIGRDNGIYFRPTDPPLEGCRSPDWYYVNGVPRVLNGLVRRSYVLWMELIAPTVLMEFVSGDGREERDATPFKGKFWIYERAIRVPYYIIYDPFRTKLEGYRLTEGMYRAIEKNEHGRLPIEPMGLELGIWMGKYEDLDLPWLRWYDPSGRLLLTGAERAKIESERARTERQKAEAERQKAEAERERAERLAARLRQLGVDPEQV